MRYASVIKALLTSVGGDLRSPSSAPLFTTNAASDGGDIHSSNRHGDPWSKPPAGFVPLGRVSGASHETGVNVSQENCSLEHFPGETQISSLLFYPPLLAALGWRLAGR